MKKINAKKNPSNKVKYVSKAERAKLETLANESADKEAAPSAE